jgi:hypothetical protein
LQAASRRGARSAAPATPVDVCSSQLRRSTRLVRGTLPRTAGVQTAGPGRASAMQCRSHAQIDCLSNRYDYNPARRLMCWAGEGGWVLYTSAAVRWGVQVASNPRAAPIKATDSANQHRCFSLKPTNPKSKFGSQTMRPGRRVPAHSHGLVADLCYRAVPHRREGIAMGRRPCAVLGAAFPPTGLAGAPTPRGQGFQKSLAPWERFRGHHWSKRTQGSREKRCAPRRFCAAG